jgi:hypothetical protein
LRRAGATQLVLARSLAGQLIVDATALKSPTESIAVARGRMPRAQPVAAFFVGPIAICRMLSSLKTGAELLFALLEILTAHFIMFPLNIAQPKPPHLSRTVDTLSSRLLQRVMSGFHLRMILGKRDHNRSALTKRILINIQFFLRYAIGQRILQRSPERTSTKQTKGARRKSNRKDRADAGNQNTRERSQCNAARKTHRSAYTRAERDTHTGLLRIDRRDGCDFPLGALGCKDRNSAPSYPCKVQHACCPLSLLTCAKNTNDALHSPSHCRA